MNDEPHLRYGDWLIFLSLTGLSSLLGSIFLDYLTGQDGQMGLFWGGVILVAIGAAFSCLIAVACLWFIPNWIKENKWVVILSVTVSCFTILLFLYLSRSSL